MAEENYSTEIGQRIKETREDKGITQQALADALPITKATMSKIEHGHLPITLDKLEKIADALETRMEYLLGFDSAVNQEAQLIQAFAQSFIKISTSKKYVANKNEVFDGKDLIFCSDEDHMVLTGTKDLFVLIKELALAENLKEDLLRYDYECMIENAKKKYSESKKDSETTEDSYFLVSGEQMQKFIEEGVHSRVYVQHLLKKLGALEPQSENPASDVKK